MKKVARLLPIVIIVMLVAALGVSSVLAAPGGNGKGRGNAGGNDNGGADTGTAELWTEPGNAYPAYGYQFVVRGSGFGPNSTVLVSIAAPGCCLATTLGADSNGEIAFGAITGEPGIYWFAAFQGRKGKGWETYAEVSVIVE